MQLGQICPPNRIFGFSEAKTSFDRLFDIFPLEREKLVGPSPSLVQSRSCDPSIVAFSDPNWFLSQLLRLKTTNLSFQSKIISDYSEISIDLSLPSLIKIRFLTEKKQKKVSH